MRAVGDHRLERGLGPEIERINRLHVIMTIKEQVRSTVRAFGVAHDHRPPWGGALFRLYPNALKLSGQPICGRLARLGISRIG